VRGIHVHYDQDWVTYFFRILHRRTQRETAPNTEEKNKKLKINTSRLQELWWVDNALCLNWRQKRHSREALTSFTRTKVRKLKCWWRKVEGRAVKFESQNLCGAGFSGIYKFVTFTYKNPIRISQWHSEKKPSDIWIHKMDYPFWNFKFLPSTVLEKKSTSTCHHCRNLYNQHFKGEWQMYSNITMSTLDKENHMSWYVLPSDRSYPGIDRERTEEVWMKGSQNRELQLNHVLETIENRDELHLKKTLKGGHFNTHL
jgi:hypothetical protein